MDMISGLLAQTQPKPQSAYDTITRLCDRLQHSSMLEDRRAAVLGLKGFSRQYREAVAAGGLRCLIQALQRDSEDLESCRATLETLIILFIKPSEAEDLSQRTRHKKYRSPLSSTESNSNESSTTTDYISLWLTDEFTQKEENIFVLLDILRNSNDFYIRLYSLQLLSAIIASRPRRAQDVIFTAPLSISTIVSVLDDSREAIRNEAILLLLNLVEDHSDVQKLVAFEGTFEKLFKIIDYEGDLAGGLVVEDCLSLIGTLLRYNLSNQNMFRESNCVPKLGRLLQLESPRPEQDEQDDDHVPFTWDDQSALNLGISLDICRLFVVQDHWATPVNQLALAKAGILMNVLRLVFGTITSISVRATALLTVADLIRSNSEIQHDFLAIDVPYVDLSIAVHVQRQPDIIPVTFALLNWALLSTSIHTFELRSAAHICLNAAFENNTAAKRVFIQEQIAHYTGQPVKISDSNDDTNGRADGETTGSHVNGDSDVSKPNGDHENSHENPASSFDPSTLPSGTANLISSLVDYDPDARLNPYKPWFASVILLYLFNDDEDIQASHDIRDLVRSVTIGDESQGEEVVTYMQAISGMLVTSLQYSDPRISIAYLMLLSVWLYDDVNAVNDFLGESATAQALISLVTTHSGGASNNVLVESMGAILLGITYDFSSKAAPISRTELHKLITSTIGRDQYVLKVKKLRDTPVFKDFDPEHYLDIADRDETGLPEVFLCGVYVNLVKDNINRIQKALDRDPLAEPNSRINLEMYDTLQSQYVTVISQLDELKQQYSGSSASSVKKISDLETAIEDATNTIKQYEVSVGEIEDERTKLSNSLNSVTQKLTEVEALYKDLSTENQQTVAQLSQSNKSLEELRQKEKKLSTLLTTMADAKEKAEAGINKMSRELMSLSRAKSDGDRKVSDLEKKVADLDKQLKKVDDSEKKIKDEYKSLQQHRNEADKRLKSLEQTKLLYDALKPQHDIVAKQLKELELEFDEAESLKQTLIEKLKSAGMQIQQDKETKTDYEAQIQELKDEISELKIEVQKLVDENENLKLQISTASSEAGETSAALDIMKSEKQIAVDKAQIQEVEITTLKSQLEELKAIGDDAQKGLDDHKNKALVVEKKLAGLKAEHDKEIADIKASHADELSDLEQEHNESILDLEISHKETISNLEKSNAEKNANAAKKLSIAHDRAIAKLKADQEAELVALTTSHSDVLDALKKELEEMKENHMSELDVSKQKLTSLEKLNAEKLVDLKESKEKQMSEMRDSHTTALTEKQNDYEDQRSSLEKELSNKHEKLSEELRDSHAAEMSILKSSHTSEIAKLTELHNKKFSDLRADHAEKHKELSKVLEETKQELKLVKAQSQAQVKELKVLAKSHEKELAEKLENAANSAGEKHALNVTELKESYEKQLQAARQDSDKSLNEELSKVKKLYEKQLSDSVSKAKMHKDELSVNAKNIEELQEEVEKLLEKYQEDLGQKEEEQKKAVDKLQELKDNHVEEVKNLRASHEKELKKLNAAKNDIELKQEKDARKLEDVNSQIQQMKDSHISELKQVKESHDSATRGATDSHNSKLQELKESHTSELEKLRESHSLEVNSIKKSHEDALKKSTEGANANAYELEALKLAHASELEKLQSKLADLEADHKVTLEKLETERKGAASKLDEAISAHRKELQEIKSLHLKESEHSAQNATEFEKLKESLRSQVQKNVYFSKQAALAEKKVAELEEKLVFLGAEGETYQQELKVSQKSIESTEKKLKSAEEKLKSDEDKLQSYETKIKSYEERIKSDEQRIKSHEEKLQAKLSKLEEENIELKKELALSKKNPKEETVAKSDLDDMMLLIADIEESKNKYKAKLKELDQEVSSDEEDSDDE